MASNKKADIQVAKRYAKALFALAKEQGKLDVVEKDLFGLSAAVAASPELATAFSSPVLSRQTQKNIAEAIAKKGKADALVASFITVLAENRRLDAISAIAAAYRVLLEEERGEVTADVITAITLDDKKIATISASLSKAISKKVNVRNKKDASIKGGAIVRIGSTMLDNSIQSKLERLRLVTKKAVSSL